MWRPMPGVCRDGLDSDGKIASAAVRVHRSPDHVEEPPEEPTVEPLDDPAEPPYEDDPGPTEMPQHDPEPQEEPTPDSYANLGVLAKSSKSC